MDLAESLKHTRAVFDPYPLDEVLLRLNRACVGWSNGRGTWVVRQVGQIEPRTPLFYWVAAEAAKHAILWCVRRSSTSQLVFRQLTDVQITAMLEAALDVQLNAPHVGTASRHERLHTDRLIDIMSRIWTPQVVFQRPSKLRFGQAVVMYRDAPRKRHERLPDFPLAAYQQVLTGVLGCTIEQFVLTLMQVTGRSHAPDPRLSMNAIVPVGDRSYDELLYAHGDRLTTRPAFGAVVSAMTLDPASLQTLADCADESAIVDLLAGPNPLLSRPLVKVFSDASDFTVAPLPGHLPEWLYEPLVNELFLACSRGAPFTRTHLAQVFEEYVGLVAQMCSPPGIRWIPESELTDGYSGRVVDWACTIGSSTIVIDAKRAFISMERRHRSHADDWAMTHRAWSDGVAQATEFWSAVRGGLVPALPVHAGGSGIVVVVTHGEPDFRAFDDGTAQEVDCYVRDKAGTQPPPWLVLSVDRFERLMTAWSKGSPGMLTEFLHRAITGNRQAVMNELPIDADGPLWAAAEALMGDLQRPPPG
jgi:hypothetical protein